MQAGTNSALPDPATLDLRREPAIPVTVLTGFLGSGKTTLIRRLIAHPALVDTAIIVNEFGEVGLDHRLVEAADEDTILLGGGCLCCATRGDLARALRSLLDRRERRELPPYRRVIVETSGLADPLPILQSFMADPLRLSRYRLSSLWALVDGILGPSTLDRHALARRQVAVADRVFVSKLDLMPQEKRALRLTRIAAAAGRPAESAAEPGRTIELLKTGVAGSPLPHSISAGEGIADDHARDHVAISRRIDRPVAQNVLGAWIATTAETLGDRILRLKGLLRDTGGGILVIESVQHLWQPPRRFFRPPPPECGTVVAIVGRGDRDAAEESLEQLASLS
ncbi:CobW family GTP-binding protein [Rhodospirillaceae bacterium SYSU D60014]|uniref:CobW family GTP-binding protein n=1 Tax=Virgifigura deserti TaxID=2268457 RepID=UPI000E675484